MGKRRRREISSSATPSTPIYSPGTESLAKCRAHSASHITVSIASPIVLSPGEGRLAKAAALLQRYHNDAVQSSADAQEEEQSHKKQRTSGHVTVPACGRICNLGKCAMDKAWCNFGSVLVPDINWASVFHTANGAEAAMDLPRGTDLRLPSGIVVQVVSRDDELEGALQRLRASMQDTAVAIDMEWRPDFGPSKNPVALIQLASSRHCLLIRLCRLRSRDPPALIDFLRDPSIHLIGYSWAGSDENKLRHTMGIGKGDFGNFLDVQVVSQLLGYHNYGLASMAQRIFGSHMPKSKRVSMSNWEAKVLTRQQIIYASLDALVCGHLLRSLRLWHASPCACPVCRYHMGGVMQTDLVLTCRTESCQRKFKDLSGLQSHVKHTGHVLGLHHCDACGRVVVPGPDPQNSDDAGSSDTDSVVQLC